MQSSLNRVVIYILMIITQHLIIIIIVNVVFIQRLFNKCQLVKFIVHKCFTFGLINEYESFCNHNVIVFL